MGENVRFNIGHVRVETHVLKRQCFGAVFNQKNPRAHENKIGEKEEAFSE